MPSMSAHMAIACTLSKKLNVSEIDFIKGNLLPDLYDDKMKSHYKIKGKRYYIPNIKEVIKNINLNDSLDLGYLSHLLLDYYYFDEYLIKYDESLFEEYSLYDDYDIINKDIIDYFNIDIDYLNNILVNFSKDINEQKLIKNKECLKLNINGNTKIIDKDDFIKFLDESSKRIYDDINMIIGKNYS